MKPPVERIMAWSLAAAFLYAGALKLRDPAQFGVELENYRLLPVAWAHAAAFFVPLLEVVVAFGLLMRLYRLGAWLLSIALGVAFTFFVCSAWFRGLDISCGCFGSSSTHVGPLVAARATVILLFACFGFWRAAKAEGR